MKTNINQHLIGSGFAEMSQNNKYVKTTSVIKTTLENQSLFR